MLTRCPGCSTTFRVTPHQLKARGGQVRCGKCNLVFNAIETLAEDSGNVAEADTSLEAETETANASAAETPHVDADLGHDLEVVDIGEAEPEPQPEPAEETPISEMVEVVSAAPDADTAADPDIDTDIEADSEAPEAETLTGEAPADVVAALAEPTNGNNDDNAETSPLTDYLAGHVEPQDGKPMWQWPWIVGSAVAILPLLLLAAYYYRIELAVLRPDLRPLLQAACKPLNCDVPRPRHIDMLGIDASDLHPDPKQPGRLMLTATLRSKAPYAQEWPLLELTLTDVADHKLATKDFAASDYLPKEKGDNSVASRISAGFPANGEIAVALPLDIGDLPAAGYRLYVFYP